MVERMVLFDYLADRTEPMPMNTISLLLFAIILMFSTTGNAVETNLDADEQILFYTSIAQRVSGETNLWRAEIRGCVFEVEKRRVAVAAFRELMEMKTEEMTDAETTLFDKRARLFLVDHKRWKKVFIRLGTNEFFVGKSGADGRFSGEITFRLAASNDFTAVVKANDARKFSGHIMPLEDEGVSVISDIDDTIKVTEVLNKRAALQNTFLREFRVVPGMAEFYQALLISNASTFHYISASPWQLYEPLSTFVASNGFPSGSFEMKQFRVKDRSFFSLFASPEKYKPGVIEPLLKQFPKRKFILIGDSGERDPEIYGALARDFPKQIKQIFIRDVTNEGAELPRYEKAFRNLPRAKWQIFREPSEIKVATE